MPATARRYRIATHTHRSARRGATDAQTLGTRARELVAALADTPHPVDLRPGGHFGDQLKTWDLVSKAVPAGGFGDDEEPVRPPARGRRGRGRHGMLLSRCVLRSVW